MTYDEEIIKEATEIYEKNENGGALVGDLLRIIKSQKAEIERLRKENEFHRKTITENAQRALEVTIEEVEKAKSEAYRKFAGRLETKIGHSELPNVVIKGCIILTLKELTESKGE